MAGSCWETGVWFWERERGRKGRSTSPWALVKWVRALSCPRHNCCLLVGPGGALGRATSCSAAAAGTLAQDSTQLPGALHVCLLALYLRWAELGSCWAALLRPHREHLPSCLFACNCCESQKPSQLGQQHQV
jgi:hypothetical protein